MIRICLMMLNGTVLPSMTPSSMERNWRSGKRMDMARAVLTSLLSCPMAAMLMTYSRASATMRPMMRMTRVAMMVNRVDDEKVDMRSAMDAMTMALRKMVSVA